MNFAVNYFGILLSVVALMIVGTVWYGPLLGKQWMKLIGMTKESMRGQSKMPMVLVFISAIVISFVLAVLLKSLLISTISGAVTVAFFVWLGFIATTMLNPVIFEKRSVQLYYINAGQYLVALLIASIILTLVR